jgi:hypothetical protein
MSQVETMLRTLEVVVDEWIYNLRQARSSRLAGVIDALRHVRPELYRVMG